MAGRPLAFLLAVALAAGCTYDRRPPAAAITEAERAPRASLGPAPVDPTVDACEDFYHYACNPWLTANPAQLDRPFLGRGLPALHERSRVWLWQRLSAPPPGAAADSLATFYAACMDEAAIERRGAADLAPLLAAIDAGSDPQSLLRATAALHRAGVPALFSTDVAWEAPGAALVSLAPTTLPPPVYFSDQRSDRRHSRRYQRHMADLLTQIGRGDGADAAAANALRVERQLAAAAPPPGASGDPLGLAAERSTWAELEARAAPLSLAAYLDAAGFARPPAVALPAPAYLEAVRRLLVEQGPAVQDYLRWALARAAAPHLPGGRLFHDPLGRPPPFPAGPRWRLCVELAEAALPDEIADLFEAEAIGAAERAALRATAEAVQRAAVRRLDQTAWLDAGARRVAADKVGRMGVHIGRPPGAVEPLPLRADAHLGNLLATRERAFARLAAQAGGGPDPRVGVAPASTANAFYRHRYNDVIVPLLLAQPPFFSPAQSPAENFGALAVVIGHEIGHAFDRNGRRLDGAGAPLEWAAASAEAVRGREVCLGERLAQYTAADRYNRSYGLLPAKAVDAERAADEHLADVAGLVFAHDAYREQRELAGPAGGAGARDGERAFFLAYAQSWCTSVHPLLAHHLAALDVHVPAPARVNAALAQVPAFAAAYDCAPGSALAPVDRCAVW